jgi:hypothetical protein
MRAFKSSHTTAAGNGYTRYRALGFSRFESMVVITLIAILMGALLQRLLFLEEVAEKTAMETTVVNIRTGLRYKVITLMIAGRTQDLPQLLDQNPIHWLENPPINYLGEFNSLADTDILPGNWYFDVLTKRLSYRLNLDAHFVSKKNGASEIQFKAILSTQKSELGNSEINALFGVRLNPISDDKWFDSLVL